MASGAMLVPPVLELEDELELLDELELELDDELLLELELLDDELLLDEELLELLLEPVPPLPEQVGTSKSPSCVP